MTNIFENIKSKLFTGKNKSKQNFIIQTLLDIILLFKNIIHWNISKLSIVLYSIVIGFVAVIPLVFIFFIYTFFSDVNMSMLIAGMFSGQLFFNFIGNILLILIVVVYFITFSYSNVLLMRVNNGYIDGEKIELKDKIYFNINRFCKYFKLSLLNILILLTPVIILAILLLILVLSSGSYVEITALVNSGALNYFTIISLLLVLIASVSVAYLYYRIVFSYLLLADDNFYDKDKSVIIYIKSSFEKTKGIKKLLKFSTVIILFLVIISPLNYIGNIFDSNSQYLSDYGWYMNLTDSEKQVIPGDKLYYYQQLELEFNGLSSDELLDKIKMNYIYIVLYTIFNFVFLYGLFIMVFSSFYKREIV